MSASLLVDLFSTCQAGVSIQGTPVLSGALVAPCSGAIIGQGIFMGNADTLCNLFVAGVSASGQLRVQVQCADSDVSGSYTDPTSGVPAGSLPSSFSSGGLLWINSGGLLGGLLGAQISGQALASGFCTGASFIRTGTFVRANLLSGDFCAGPLTVGFFSQLRTVGSGGGFTLNPTSGTVNV